MKVAIRLIVALGFCSLSALSATSPLLVEEPIIVPDSKGGFDILIPEGPEYVIYDPASDRIFQNIKSNDSLLVIDPASNTIQQRWKTAPARKPHGLAIDSDTKRLFCAGQNGKLAVIDATSGKV